LSGSEGLIVYIGNFFANSSSNYQAVVTGHTTSYNISVVPVAGFSADVTLSVAGMPKGATTSFSPSAVVKSGSGSATLTISADTTTTLGLYTLTITAAAGSLTHSVQVGLGVNSSPGSFSVAISPNPIPWVAGTDGLGGVVSITPDGGFTGDVALSLSGVPVGLEPGFYGNVVTGGSGAAYLFLLVDPGTAPGNYTFTITGTSGALVSSTKVVVTVSSQ
jgi:uncharacterized membrane protein